MEMIRPSILGLVLSCMIASVTGDCIGEFQQCSDGSCVLVADFCGRCSSGQYLCPDGTSCVKSATDWVSCPNVKGTHFDWTLDIESRVAYLSKQTDLNEKIAQLTNDAPSIPHLSVSAYNWLSDDVHSVQQRHSTVFPDGCGLGSSWSKKRAQDVGWVIGQEARGTHNGLVHSGNRGHNQNGAGITIYAPNMNTVRDPRWGRAQEVYSEDPKLSSDLTVSFVRGAQATNETHKYKMTGACCKHLAAYDVEDDPQQRYFFSANVTTRNMWETFLPVFRACLAEGQAMHAMCSYNAINGVPACAEPRLMNGILRKKWNWNGFIVSDYDAWAQIYDTHKYCPDYECAAAAGINAGMDQEGGGTAAINRMSEAVSHGRVTTDTVDQAFRRLMRARIQLGMFDPPTSVEWNYLANDTSNVLSDFHIRLARDIARESICLYKNKNDVLPLDSAKLGSVALIGPQAPALFLLLGNYAQLPDVPYAVVSALEAIVQEMGQDTAAQCFFEYDIDYYQYGQTGIPVNQEKDCCHLCSTVAWCKYFTYYLGSCYLKSNNTGRVSSQGRISGSCKNPGKVVWAPGCDTVSCEHLDLPDAEAAAANADVVIIFLGLDMFSIEREGHDRKTIELPPGQNALVAAMRSVTNKPIIAVMIHGGVMGLSLVEPSLDGIIDAWYPGMQGGPAISDVLFGHYNPAGRTPVTWYQDQSQLPKAGMMDLYPNKDSLGLTYRYFTGKTLYPFGYGLSYTTFAYSGLQINGTSFKACDWIGVTFNVKNTGTVTGDEVVQVYVKQPQATVPVPRVRLAAFDRLVQLKPGEVRSVTLGISPEYHSVVYETGVDVYTATVAVEKGQLNLFVGGGQPDFGPTLSGSVTISNTQDISTC